MEIIPPPPSDAMSAPRAVRDVSLPVLLHFLARGLVLALPVLVPRPLPALPQSLPSPSSIGALSSPTGANNGLTRPVPSSSQQCWRRSSAAQPLKTRHIHSVSESLYPQVKHPHVALSTEVRDLPRLVFLFKGFVLAQVDLISGICGLRNAQERTLHTTDLPRLSCGSVLHPFDQSPTSRLARFEAELGFSGIHCIMFSGSAFASAPLLITVENFTISFLVRSSAMSSRCHRPPVIREPCHACKGTYVAWSTAGDFATCGSPRSIQPH